MSQTLLTLAERALATPSLLRLWDAVEDYADACRAQDLATTEGGLDLADLPTYGGDVPAHIGNGISIRSWDETHLLIDRRHQQQRFVVVRRSVYAA